MKIIFSICLLFATNHCIAQNEYFEEIKNEMIPRTISTDSINRFQENIRSFIGTELDSNDVEFLSSKSVLGLILVENIGKDITYQLLFNKMVKLKNSVRNYEYLKNQYSIVKNVSTIPVTADWSVDSLKIIKTGVSSDVLSFILKARKTLKNHTGQLNYGDLFNNSSTENRSKIEKFSRFLDRKTSINYKNIENSEKPKLLYFRGLTTVNCAKFERNLSQHENFEETLNKLESDYNFIVLTVDSRIPLHSSEVYFSKTLDREIKTIGGRNLDFEMSQFNTMYQPYFVITNNNFEKIREIGFVEEIDKFIDFLEGE